MRISDWSSDVCSSDLATGKIVTPGLVAAGTALGLIEVRAVETTDDRATDARELSDAFDAGYGLNHDTLLIPVARLGGITRTIAHPAYRSARRRVGDEC